ncbi:hypothetical protein Pla123a_10790 [Posidoniimonas polymericola]|uniref:Outer membrane protein beta-barrel domain-containing protein n=1 Tax=Posidoniimonas polymericola TaxID=2528002 RepID=A0A5C5YTK0_9BACT|nr:BBP7 family outer membrane beta-barrel protein [Posidoniimonas polymericola]TWT78288.1 hypothetical protein Pla123a_10790 [Posidoniimonas polymericola]
MTNTVGIAKVLTLFSVALLIAPGQTRAEETPPLPMDFYEEVPRGEAPSIEEYVYSEPGSPVSDLTTDSFNLWDSCPAAPESSGTWLRRGWWAAEIDTFVFVRKWDIANQTIATDGSIFNPNTLRSIGFGRTMPTAASGRLNLSRFLFRDGENRDHRFEFNVMGGGESVASCHLDSNNANAIQVPFTIDGAASISFDGASSMDASYSSQLNSFELNYTVTSRMERDRMELQPDGQWVRRANSGVTYHGLAGMRYIDLSENIFWTANDIISVPGNADPLTGETGQYNVKTNNDMFGFQAGGGVAYESHRWSVTLFARGGFAFNDAKSNSNLTYTDPVTGDARTDIGFANSDRTGSMPFFIQGGLLGRYHLRPNVSIRAGYEYMYVTAVGLAPHQLNFTPNDGKVVTSGNPFMHGLTLGGEFYW